MTDSVEKVIILIVGTLAVGVVAIAILGAF